MLDPNLYLTDERITKIRHDDICRNAGDMLDKIVTLRRDNQQYRQENAALKNRVAELQKQLSEQHPSPVQQRKAVDVLWKALKESDQENKEQAGRILNLETQLHDREATIELLGHQVAENTKRLRGHVELIEATHEIVEQWNRTNFSAPSLDIRAALNGKFWKLRDILTRLAASTVQPATPEKPSIETLQSAVIEAVRNACGKDYPESCWDGIEAAMKRLESAEGAAPCPPN